MQNEFFDSDTSAPRRSILGVLVSGIAVTLAGCSGSESAEDSPPTPEPRPDLYVAGGRLEPTSFGDLKAYVTVENGGTKSGSATLSIQVTIRTGDTQQFTPSREITLDADESEEYEFAIDVPALSSMDPNKEADLDTSLEPHY